MNNDGYDYETIVILQIEFEVPNKSDLRWNRVDGADKEFSSGVFLPNFPCVCR